MEPAEGHGGEAGEDKKVSNAHPKHRKINKSPLFDTVDPTSGQILCRAKIGAVHHRVPKRPINGANHADWYKYYQQIDVSRLDILDDAEKAMFGVDIVRKGRTQVYVTDQFNCFQSSAVFASLGRQAADAFLQAEKDELGSY